MDVKTADAICELLRKYREIATWRAGLADRDTRFLRIELQNSYGLGTHIVPLGIESRPGRAVYDALRAHLYVWQCGIAQELKGFDVDMGRTMTDADLDERERVLADEEAF